MNEIAFIEIHISPSNNIDKGELKQLINTSKGIFKDAEYITEYNRLLTIKLKDYYVKYEYDDVKDFAYKMSKVLLTGQISIVLDSAGEDSYKFVIMPNKVEYYEKECNYVKKEAYE